MFGKKKGTGGQPDDRPESEPAPEPRPARETYPASPLPGHRGSGIMTPGVSRRSATSRPAAPTPRASPENEGRKLVVGREISLSGEIKACEKLVVEGTVEADLTDSSFLEISASGIFVGNAQVMDCDISGTFEGDLTVKGRLMLRATGVVRGALRYHELEAERGGRLIGTVDVLTSAAEAAVSDSDMAATQDTAEGPRDATGDATGDAAADAATGSETADAEADPARRPRGIKGLVDQDAETPGGADAGDALR